MFWRTILRINNYWAYSDKKKFFVGGLKDWQSRLFGGTKKTEKVVYSEMKYSKLYHWYRKKKIDTADFTRDSFVLFWRRKEKLRQEVDKKVIHILRAWATLPYSFLDLTLACWKGSFYVSYNLKRRQFLTVNTLVQNFGCFKKDDSCNINLKPLVCSSLQKIAIHIAVIEFTFV